MKFAGWEKLSLTDYPEKMATTLFTSGCNFDCAYCHNAVLKQKIEGRYTEKAILDFFYKRKKMLDALVITGGEPTLYKGELLSFAERFKRKFPDKLLKIDSNGSNPALLKQLAEWADFCAVDLKSDDYSSFSNTSIDTIKKSISVLKAFSDHEVRITCYPPYVNDENIKSMLSMVKSKGVRQVAIQQYNPIDDHQEQYSPRRLKRFARYFEETGIKTVIRGV